MESFVYKYVHAYQRQRRLSMGALELMHGANLLPLHFLEESAKVGRGVGRRGGEVRDLPSPRDATIQRPSSTISVGGQFGNLCGVVPIMGRLAGPSATNPTQCDRLQHTIQANDSTQQTRKQQNRAKHNRKPNHDTTTLNTTQSHTTPSTRHTTHHTT